MGTRSAIGVRKGNTVDFVRCHYDGYPKHVGNALVKYFNDAEKAEALLDAGNYIAIDVTEQEVSADEIPVKLFGCLSVTSNEPGSKKTCQYKEFGSTKQRKHDWDIEYYYLFDKRWLVAGRSTGWWFFPVPEVIAGTFLKEHKQHEGRRMTEAYIGDRDEQAKTRALSEFTGVPESEIEKEWHDFFIADHVKYLVSDERSLNNDVYELMKENGVDAEYLTSECPKEAYEAFMLNLNRGDLIDDIVSLVLDNLSESRYDDYDLDDVMYIFGNFENGKSRWRRMVYAEDFMDPVTAVLFFKGKIPPGKLTADDDYLLYCTDRKLVSEEAKKLAKEKMPEVLREKSDEELVELACRFDGAYSYYSRNMDEWIESKAAWAAPHDKEKAVELFWNFTDFDEEVLRKLFGNCEVVESDGKEFYIIKA